MQEYQTTFGLNFDEAPVHLRNQQLYISSIASFSRLSDEETLELAKKAADGDIEARNQLIEGNLRLAYFLAKKAYEGYARRYELDDLVQEANRGLTHAAIHYDYTKGVPFSAYASDCICGLIKRATCTLNSPLHIPVHMNDLYMRMVRTSYSIIARTGHEPSIYEIAEEMGESAEKLKELIQAYNLISLDMPFRYHDDESDVTLGDTISDSDEADFLAPFSSEIMECLEKCLRNRLISDSERMLIRKYYGLDGDSSKTFRELSAELGFSYQRAQQIFKKGMKKLQQIVNAKYQKEDLFP